MIPALPALWQMQILINAFPQIERINKMNIKLSMHVVGIFLKFFGLFMLVPAVVSFIYKDGDLYIFLLTSILITTLGFLLENITKACRHVNVMERKDAFFIAFLCWIVACLVGAIPYFLVPLPVFSHPVHALFESVSGFTTNTVFSVILRTLKHCGPPNTGAFCS